MDCVVSRMNATLSGGSACPAASAVAFADMVTDDTPIKLVKKSGTTAVCSTRMPLADVLGV